MEKYEKIIHCSRQLWPDWENMAQEAMARYGSKGLREPKGIVNQHG